MKFPTVTVVLVSAALIFVVWDKTREPPEPVEASRFTNLAANPVERGTAVDWVTGQVPGLCEEATGAAPGTAAHANCLEDSEAREPACRRAAADRFPGIVASEAVFRDLSITLMNCLVPQSRPID
ncbi:hypothetical protein QQF73_04860 [Marinobacter sp. M216]|uniref:Uncharacterized protein n=1 Tax=Marinobacter albus TaxID=3030833 RepID=A0ABT7HAB3_9GAMM|nr:MULTISPECIES: hypothetical protein [unclassified Marinobacter]MBW7470783.1 hypothetical protein [Marinobacter sp. F4218]MDK9556947.1 hypothetical protein [Marinobacter sp. M216]